MKKLAVFALFCLAGCGQQSGESGGEANGAGVAVIGAAPTALDISKAAELTPSDPALAAKYDRSCRSCHSIPDAAAPLTGHKAAWDRRFAAKNVADLVASTKAGLNAMPAMGLCNDCTDDELMRLTEFMAGKGN